MAEGENVARPPCEDPSARSYDPKSDLGSKTSKGPRAERVRDEERRPPAKRTTNRREWTKQKMAMGAVMYPQRINQENPRPRTRGECHGARGVDLTTNELRPCPWVSCAWHLKYDVHPDTGSIRDNFPGIELEQLAETCVLDVADRGGHSLREVGDLVNLTKERIRQIEQKALASLREASERRRDGREQRPVRRLPVLTTAEAFEIDEEPSSARTGVSRG